jgi:hypothetical protein
MISPSRLSRRRFLRKSTAGFLILSAARLLPFGSVEATVRSGVPSTLKYFSAEEFVLIRALSGRITGVPFDGGAEQIDVALRADRFLAHADPDIQEEFHLLLTVMNSAILAFFLDFRLSSFVNMSVADQDAYLDDWMNSMFAFRRTAFQAIKRLSMSMYYTDGRSWPPIGYDGMFLPEDRK